MNEKLEENTNRLKRERHDRLKHDVKTKIKSFVEEFKPELIAGGVVLGGLALWGFYMMGLKDGKRIYSHGPCIEVGHRGAKGLLSGKFMVLRVDGPDVLYKLVDHDPVS